jgi:phage regulator Rha-like protein
LAQGKGLFEMSEDSKPRLAASRDDGRSYDMTREGFTLLVMGWDDKKSIKFKMTYIKAFEAMLAALKEHQPYVAATALKPLRALFPNSPKIRWLFDFD